MSMLDILQQTIILPFSDKSNSDKERTEILVISDIHLGIDDSYAEIGKNKPILVEFLHQ